MFVPLIIIGTADDGPDGTLFQPRTSGEAENVFGWYQREYYTLQANQASATTRYPVWGGQVEAYKKVGSRLYNDSLYSLRVQASGTYMTFGEPGVSGTYLFRYIRVPDDDNIVWAMNNALQQNSDMPYLYRVPGTRSYTIIGDLKLEAEYSGQRYDSISVIVDSGILTIYYTVDHSASSSVSYDIHQPINLLVAQINGDHYSNKHPLLAYCSVVSPAIPSGTYTTSGGVNGQVTASSVYDAVSALDLDSVGLILIAGSPSSGIVSTALDFVEGQGELSGAACIVASAPPEFRGKTAEDFESFLNNLPFNSNKLFYVPGWGTSTLSPVNPTWIPLSHVFSGLWSAYTSAPTNKVNTLDNVTPIWSTAQLHSLGERYCVFNKFIINNFAPWRSGPTNGENPLISKVKMDIANRIGSAFEYVIGEPAILPNKVYEIASKALDGLDNVKELRYTCEVGTYYIVITVYVIVYGETQYIEMSLVSRRPENA